MCLCSDETGFTKLGGRVYGPLASNKTSSCKTEILNRINVSTDTRNKPNSGIRLGVSPLKQRFNGHCQRLPLALFPCRPPYKTPPFSKALGIRRLYLPVQLQGKCQRPSANTCSYFTDKALILCYLHRERAVSIFTDVSPIKRDRFGNIHSYERHLRVNSVERERACFFK